MTNITKEKKKELKQFELTDKTSCIVYLLDIIGISEKCIRNMRRYIAEAKDILEGFREGDRIPYDTYLDASIKISGVQSYLLNVLGDAQTISISYFKYRSVVGKYIKRGNTDLTLLPMTSDIDEILKNFNLMRNWLNHVPESLLNSEIEMIKEGKAFPHSKNPLEINIHMYVTYEYMLDMYDTNVEFYHKARQVIQFIKKEYSMLIGEDVKIITVYSEKPVDVDHLEMVKMSAEIQGLP